MSKSKNHIYFGDILAIIISISLSVYSFILTKNILLFLFYGFVSIFRLIILILQITIVRKKDDVSEKFKKEKVISRVSGITLLLSTQLIYALIFGQIGILEKSVYATQVIYIAIPFGIYTLYKFISAFISLKKSRRKFSPYRETISGINFIVAFISLIPLAYFILSLFGVRDINNTIAIAVLFPLCILVFGITIFISIKMIISRKTPNLLK